MFALTFVIITVFLPYSFCSVSSNYTVASINYNLNKAYIVKCTYSTNDFYVFDSSGYFNNASKSDYLGYSLLQKFDKLLFFVPGLEVFKFSRNSYFQYVDSIYKQQLINDTIGVKFIPRIFCHTPFLNIIQISKYYSGNGFYIKE